VENKTHGLGAETCFDFKYIPDFHTSTILEGLEETGPMEPGIERRNLRTLIIASTIVSIASWYGVKMALKGLYALVR
jgi:predicted secreted protein